MLQSQETGVFILANIYINYSSIIYRFWEN